MKMLLATSFKRGVAVDFARRNSGAGKPPVIYTFHYHPELRCAHVNFIPSVVPGEDEFLFAAYPLFFLHLKVQSERSSAKGTERVSAFCGFGLQCHMYVDLVTTIDNLDTHVIHHLASLQSR